MFLDNKFKTKRLETGMKVPEVSEKIGIKPGTLWAYENGNRIPCREILLKLSKFYKCPVEYFFSD